MKAFPTNPRMKIRIDVTMTTSLLTVGGGDWSVVAMIVFVGVAMVESS